MLSQEAHAVHLQQHLQSRGLFRFTEFLSWLHCPAPTLKLGGLVLIFPVHEDEGSPQRTPHNTAREPRHRGLGYVRRDQPSVVSLRDTRCGSFSQDPWGHPESQHTKHSANTQDTFPWLFRGQVYGLSDNTIKLKKNTILAVFSNNFLVTIFMPEYMVMIL